MLKNRVANNFNENIKNNVLRNKNTPLFIVQNLF